MHFLDQTSVHFMPQTPVFGFRLAKAPSDQMLLVLLGLALPLQSESTAQSPQLAPGARRWTQQPPLAYVAQGELTLVARGAAAAQGKAEEGEVVEEWEETIQEEGPGWSRQEQMVVTAVVGGSQVRWALAHAVGGAAQGGGVARQQAERVGVRRDNVVGADVDGGHDAAPLGGGAVLGRAGGGRGARPVGQSVAADRDPRAAP